MANHRRAILADIAEFNLDPTVAHKGTHANGRLKAPVAKSVEDLQSPTDPTVVETSSYDEVVDETPKNALVELSEEPKEIKTEEPSVETPDLSSPKKKGKK